jgi:UDP-N-acetylglucosamine--N-acetylmuramyl-(pentapeptide) pyrophosphoryl-undecaprenol N-acetylglucosamine transferase
VLLIMGGSQGAKGINDLACKALPALAAQMPDVQFLHLTGAMDCRAVQTAYTVHNLRAVVRPFLTEMDLALGAATVAINRAGASSLSESAAMQVPAILIPYPHATDNHQFYNAQALVQSGAALQLDQSTTTPELLANTALGLLKDASARAAMQHALGRWFFPNAAAEMAGHIFRLIKLKKPEDTPTSDEPGPGERPLRPPPNWSGRSFKLETAPRPPK